MNEKDGLTRRSFLRKGAMVTAIGAACTTGMVEIASAKSGTYATLIDLAKCDGCKNEPIPKCVEACRKVNENKFPNPKEPDQGPLAAKGTR